MASFGLKIRLPTQTQLFCRVVNGGFGGAEGKIDLLQTTSCKSVP